jgi:hypothetical protein
LRKSSRKYFAEWQKNAKINIVPSKFLDENEGKFISTWNSGTDYFCCMIKLKVQYHPPRPEGSPGHSAWLPIEKNPLRRT